MPTGIVWSGASDSNDFANPAAEVFESVYVYFRKEGALVDVLTPSVSILKDGVKQTLKTLSPDYGGQAYGLNRMSTGYYSFVFYTQGMAPGLYSIVFSGTDPAPLPNYGVLTVTGGFQVGYVSQEVNLVRILRQHLMDLDPNLYTIIDKTVNVWKDEALLTYLVASLTDVNMTPSPSSFTLSSFPYTGLLIDGAFSRACRAAAVLETWNTMQYTDEVAFVVDRSAKLLSLAQQASKDFFDRLDKWKVWWSLYGDDADGGTPSAQWMGENKVPYQISRVLSFLPNMKNTFGL